MRNQGSDEMSPQATAAAAAERGAPSARREWTPAVSIVVPALNEEPYIEACLESLLSQWPADRVEILVLDGGSSDRTVQLAEAVSRSHPAVRVIPNPKRLQSAAVNLAARVARPDAAILVRADAHAVYPQGFVAACVRELLRTGATSVVVPMRTEARPDAPVQRAIAAAQASRAGNGGSAHRTGSAPSGFVDHGHHAAFDRAFFVGIGGYDESFSHNEDAEFDLRALRAGGRIWMCAETPVVYFPRRTLRGLARQYLAHGAGRARTVAKHSARPRARQLAPIALVAVVAGGALAAPLQPLLAIPALIYAGACASWGAAQAIRWRDPALLLAGPALTVMHLAWGTGFVRRTVSEVVGRHWRGAVRPRKAAAE